MVTAAPASTIGSKPLSYMEKLDPLVSYYRPLESSDTSADQQPQLVIVSSWTDARDAHIAKYITKYRSMYPSAQILLLRSTMDCIFRPSQIGNAMKKAAAVVRAVFHSPTTSSSPPLLIHMFSNGGSSSIANLYDQYEATASLEDDKFLPSHITIFDSCPGRFSMPSAVTFVSVGLSYFQRLLAAPFLYAFALLWTALMYLGFLQDSLGDWYNSHNVHAANTKEIKRVYIYSNVDALIDYNDVEAHAAEAEKKGFSVALERYEGSAHVAHIRKDEDRYWRAIEKAMGH